MVLEKEQRVLYLVKQATGSGLRHWVQLKHRIPWNMSSTLHPTRLHLIIPFLMSLWGQLYSKYHIHIQTHTPYFQSLLGIHVTTQRLYTNRNTDNCINDSLTIYIFISLKMLQTLSTYILYWGKVIKCIYTNRESKQCPAFLFMGKAKVGKGQLEDIPWAPLSWEGQHKRKGQCLDKRHGDMIKKMGKCRSLINCLTQSLLDYFQLRAFLLSNDRCQPASMIMFFSPLHPSVFYLSYTVCCISLTTNSSPILRNNICLQQNV